MTDVGQSVATDRAEVERIFWDVWWTCGSCHRSYPKDYGPDWCDHCDVRLRRNDDIRLALRGRSDA